MTDYPHISLKNSVSKLLEEIAAQTKNHTETELDIARLEKLARLVSIQLKAIDELQIHEARAAARRKRKRYTRFEELLPPPPHEYDRMVDLLNRHFGVSEETQEPANDTE